MKNRFHFIDQDLLEFDLQVGVWAFIGMKKIEDYLAKWARFEETHGA